MDINSWNDTWETINWMDKSKDAEDKIIRKIEEFYKAGVDFNMENEFFMMPLMYAAKYSTPKVMDLMISGGADPAFRHKIIGSTALHDAVLSDKLGNVKYLIEHGPRNFVNVKDKLGRTAFDRAREQGKTKIAIYLKLCSKKSMHQTFPDVLRNKMSLIKDKTR